MAPHGRDVAVEGAPKPDPGTEELFEVEDNVLAFSPGRLSEMFGPKSLPALKSLGGIEGLEKGLQTNLISALSQYETTKSAVSFEDATATGGPVREDRRRTRTHPQSWAMEPHAIAYTDRLHVFGDTQLPERKSQLLLQLMWIALNDKVLLLLSAAAAISLALGLYQQTFGVVHDPAADGASVDWVEGVTIMVAVGIVVVVGAGNDYQKERQFVKLNKKKEDRTVKAIRSGKSVELSVCDLLVGDICHFEPSDLIPSDGIFTTGHNVKCDESSATGESDAMKMPGHEATAQFSSSANLNPSKLGPFIISGSKVLQGVGTFVVTAVGVRSSFGKTMMASREESDDTPLQRKLNNLAEATAKLGGAAALLLFIVLFIRFLVQLRGNAESPSEKGQKFMRILITAITVVAVAVPEGLPLAVTLALAYATTRMLNDNNLVRVLQACETMGNATTVCSDKTGTLTQNRMTVVASIIGAHRRFGDRRAAGADDASQNKDVEKEAQESSITEFTKSLPVNVKELLLQSIIQNSTAFKGKELEDGKPTFIGSKTETAMLTFAQDYLGISAVHEERATTTVVQMVPFDSGRKCIGAVVKLEDGQFRLMVKGASEIMLSRCTRITPLDDSLAEAKITPELQTAIGKTISAYANRSLRTIGMLYRDFPVWPPAGARPLEDDSSQAEFDDVFDEMTWIGTIGIQDPLRPGVREAVLRCQKAGAFLRMVTSDDALTAKACGIYPHGSLVMEGPKFRQLAPVQMDQVISRLQVLGRSSPEGKHILVKRLKELGETVAVTAGGGGTNDGPALKTADVGFSMGIAGTEVAKEASAIILMDGNFASIVKAFVNYVVKEFPQFPILVNTIDTFAWMLRTVVDVENTLAWNIGTIVTIIMQSITAVFNIIRARVSPKACVNPRYLFYPRKGDRPRPAFVSSRKHGQLWSAREPAQATKRRQSTGVKGMLNGIDAVCFADSGSELNLITLEHAARYGISVDKSPKNQRKVKLSNGNSFHIIGKATVPWIFPDDPTVHQVTFDVVLKCFRTVIFGNSFLQNTLSLTREFEHRLIDMGSVVSNHFLRQNVISINSIGKVHHRVPLWVHGKNGRVRVQALPDTGADGNVFSEEFVRRKRWRILKSDTVFMFPDGTVQESVGRIRMPVSVEGQDSGRSYADFEVMRGCRHDAILGHDFVFDHGLFYDANRPVGSAVSLGLNLVIFLKKKKQQEDPVQVQERQRKLAASLLCHQQALAERSERLRVGATLQGNPAQATPKPPGLTGGGSTLTSGSQPPPPPPPAGASLPLTTLTPTGNTVPQPVAPVQGVTGKHRLAWRKIFGI